MNFMKLLGDNAKTKIMHHNYCHTHRKLSAITI
jgi:hypothetical protein